MSRYSQGKRECILYRAREKESIFRRGRERERLYFVEGERERVYFVEGERERERVHCILLPCSHAAVDVPQEVFHLFIPSSQGRWATWSCLPHSITASQPLSFPQPVLAPVSPISPACLLSSVSLPLSPFLSLHASPPPCFSVSRVYTHSPFNTRQHSPAGGC